MIFYVCEKRFSKGPKNGPNLENLGNVKNSKYIKTHVIKYVEQSYKGKRGGGGGVPL